MIDVHQGEQRMYCNVVRKQAFSIRFINRSTIVSLVAFCFLSMAVCAAQSATYYVDYQSGSDSNNGSSTSSPWKRCPGMAGFTGSYTHSNGDIFVFKGGVTWPTPSASGLLTMAYSGVTGSEDKYVGGQRCGQAGSPSCNGGEAWGSGYPVFDGNKYSSIMVRSYNSNWVVDGIKFYNVGNPPTDPSGQGLVAVGGSNIEVKNCLFETLSINAFYYGINTGNSSSKIYFHDNYIKRSGRVPIQPSAEAFIDDIKIYNNTYEGLADYEPGAYHPDGFMIGGDKTTSAYSITNLKIYNNKFFGDWSRGATALIYLNSSLSDLYPSTQNTEIYNNQFAFENNSWDGSYRISPALVSVAGRHDNVKIYNNTFSADAIPSYPVSACISLAYANISNLEIKNNIFSGCDNGILRAAKVTSTPTIDYNLYNTAGGNHLIYDAYQDSRCNTLAECQALGFETHGVKADPKFKALPSGGVTGSGNWALQSGSPAIAVGVNLGSYFVDDLVGRIRPGGSWTLGALEYSNSLLPPKLSIATK